MATLNLLCKCNVSIAVQPDDMSNREHATPWLGRRTNENGNKPFVKKGKYSDREVRTLHFLNGINAGADIPVKEVG